MAKIACKKIVIFQSKKSTCVIIFVSTSLIGTPPPLNIFHGKRGVVRLERLWASTESPPLPNHPLRKKILLGS